MSLGLIGLAVIVVAAASGAIAVLLVTLWLGWPSVVLIVVWGRSLRSG